TRQVLDRFDHDPLKVVAWKDRATASDYATFAPLVMHHADAGDPAAQAIVGDAARHVEALGRRLLTCGAPRLALLGGLAPALEPRLSADLRRRLVPIAGDAVSGALYLARRAAMASPVDRAG